MLNELAAEGSTLFYRTPEPKTKRSLFMANYAGFGIPPLKPKPATQIEGDSLLTVERDVASSQRPAEMLSTYPLDLTDRFPIPPRFAPQMASNIHSIPTTPRAHKQ